jgi:hypothetical protein
MIKLEKVIGGIALVDSQIEYVAEVFKVMDCKLLGTFFFVPT